MHGMFLFCSVYIKRKCMQWGSNSSYFSCGNEKRVKCLYFDGFIPNAGIHYQKCDFLYTSFSLKHVDILLSTGTIENVFYIQKIIKKTSFTSFLFARCIKNYVHSISQGITTLILVCSNLYNYLMQVKINVCHSCQVKTRTLAINDTQRR